ncbi:MULTISPECIES: flavin reductase family protein [Nocardia]|jgi:flavin reductase (DIM6/NTAB) family NADH-FMN oxidoreductase RutF|uniref:flavin reductase family protein n=1 Tax=Nocardia TaxID=1817 RepID=UPI001894146E|nr:MULTISPECIES: flavin reductase family protein [Nocardia]MBF6220047.1 flavin reductase [Nocardia abscessus]MDE1673156.1 flavin reductase family protein [Nocardia gipuzkoensis]
MATEDRTAVFDAVVAAADYPVLLVTVQAEGRRAGCLVGFATQVSIEPRRFLIGLSKKNHTYRVAQRADRLAVHVLSSEQLSLARLFGGETGDDIDKFVHCDWHSGPGGIPVLSTVPSWFSARIRERYDFGDHAGLLLEPEDAAVRRHPAETLHYHSVADLVAGHAV